MSKTRDNKMLKIVAATSVTIFTLFSCFSGVIAWFTSIRTLSNTNDQIVIKELDSTVSAITVHPFLGDSVDGNYYAFNPTDSGHVDFDGMSGEFVGAGVEMGEYSLENPNHPVLVMFKVSGGKQRINFVTDYAFLGSAEPADASLKTTVASYSALTALDTSSLDVDDIIKVTADEKHNGLKSCYKYTGVSYEMVWIELDDAANPLSSVVTFHYLGFSGNSIANNSDTMSVNVLNNTGGYTPTDNVDCIPVAKSALTSSNKTSFSNFTGIESYDYTTSVDVYDSDVGTYHYIGIVVNYDSYALEYIFSRYLGHDYLSEGLFFTCDWITRV